MIMLVLYPEGNVGTEYQMLFNHDKIKSIEFRGYENEERERFIKTRRNLRGKRRINYVY